MSIRDSKLLAAVTIRTDPKPGDAADLVRMHGEIYAREHQFDKSFSASEDQP